MFQIQFLLAIVSGFAKSVGDYVADYVDQFTDAFPNPTKMFDVALNFFTGMPGLIVSAPFEGMKEFVLTQLRKGKVLKRVMTLEQAVNLAFDAHAEFARNVTFTDSSGIVGWLAGVIGRFLWTLGKRIKFILALLKAKTEDQVIAVVLNSLKSKAALIRVVAVVIGAILLVHTVGFLFWVIGLGLIFLEGSYEKRLLFPNRPRIAVDKNSRQYRQGVSKAKGRAGRGISVSRRTEPEPSLKE